MNRSSLDLHFYQHLILSVLDIGYFVKFVAVTPCFSLHFSGDIQQLFICLFAICMSGEVSVNVFGPFFSWVVHFLLVEF